MNEKIKGILNAIIILLYILMIGSLIVNNEHFIYKENWMLLLNIVLLGIGFYYFVQYNSKE